jgi:hypothetical protein
MITNIRKFSILPPLGRARDFRGHHCAVNISHGIGYKERVSADDLKLVVLEIGRIALVEHTLDKCFTNFLEKQ